MSTSGHGNEQAPEEHFHKIQPISENPPLEGEEEKTHFKQVVSAFQSYREYASKRIISNIRMVEALPEQQQILLASYRESLDKQLKCVEHNQTICDLIVKKVEYIFENTGPVFSDKAVQPTSMDIDRVQSTLRQFVRDWSSLGAPERDSCYQPIIKEVVDHFPAHLCETSEVSILVPGAGLGRLTFEFAARGYQCQGNDFSLYMLFGSNFVLNKATKKDGYTLHPWVHNVENNISSENQMQTISFPDINPNATLHSIENFFSMTGGDFLQIYSENDSWDCVTTCFFIDCAHNVCDFIIQIFKILKPGGIWVNLGPLLYHFSNMEGEQSIEPSYADIRNIMLGVGFIIEKEETGVKTRYGHNPLSMLQYQYESVFFVCKKPKVEVETEIPEVAEIKTEIPGIKTEADERMDTSLWDQEFIDLVNEELVHFEREMAENIEFGTKNAELEGEILTNEPEITVMENEISTEVAEIAGIEREVNTEVAEIEISEIEVEISQIENEI